MDSIMQKEKRCFFCWTTRNLEMHHIFFGTANRKISEANGFKVWLCNHCHTGGTYSVHRNRERDFLLKQRCQIVYESKHSRAEFMKLIGRSYL